MVYERSQFFNSFGAEIWPLSPSENYVLTITRFVSKGIYKSGYPEKKAMNFVKTRHITLKKRVLV